MTQRAGILFTAFEPSGDAVAAPVIAELKRRDPHRPIYALGGPRMQAAGAQLIERTTDHPVMLAGAASQAVVHHRRLGRLRAWMKQHKLDAVVPTDSPAANWSVCQLTRQLEPQAKVVHLVAPQLWAWAPWRIGKLRRLTDRVLCLLPFEPAWFEPRGVPAVFVGHPLYSSPTTADAPDAADPAPTLPTTGRPRLALLPGSRVSEVKANWPVMREAAALLRQRHPELEVCVAASDEARARLIQRLSPGGRLEEGISLVVGNASAVLRWADAAVVVSGTATLEAAARGTPMVVVYRLGRLSWELAGRWLIQTRTFALPNLVGRWLGREAAVPELVPFFGSVQTLLAGVEPLLVEGEARQRQRELFDAIAEAFGRCSFARDSAQALEEALGQPRPAR